MSEKIAEELRKIKNNNTNLYDHLKKLIVNVALEGRTLDQF
jgi:hypothetical protein